MSKKQVGLVLRLVSHVHKLLQLILLEARFCPNSVHSVLVVHHCQRRKIGSLEDWIVLYL